VVLPININLGNKLIPLNSTTSCNQYLTQKVVKSGSVPPHLHAVSCPSLGGAASRGRLHSHSRFLRKRGFFGLRLWNNSWEIIREGVFYFNSRIKKSTNMTRVLFLRNIPGKASTWERELKSWINFLRKWGSFKIAEQCLPCLMKDQVWSENSLSIYDLFSYCL
jgi:hypothetical protein